MDGKEILIIRDKTKMRNWTRSRRNQGESICLVPTMGCLHRGHLALVEVAKSRAHRVVVSIYVNPSQFAVTEDFNSYPSNLEADLAKLRELAVDVVFNPAYLYSRKDAGSAGSAAAAAVAAGSAAAAAAVAAGAAVSCLEDAGNEHQTWIRVEKLEKPLCGKSRPIFFRGVATVVAKLFNIVEPDMAVFGKKDYQQWRLICQMVHDLDFAVEIIGSEIVRDLDGLALSSRNLNLSHEDRLKALSISRSLRDAKDAVSKGETNTRNLKQLILDAISESDGKIDYVEVVDRLTLQTVERIEYSAVICVAAWFGEVRLIDNMEVQIPRI